MSKFKKQDILWIDCIGGLVVGVLILCVCRLISVWDNLPIAVVIGVGIANLSYGSYSLWVTLRKPRPLSIVKFLSLANMAWLAVCISIVAFYWKDISAFGIFHKLGEGLYVASLGVLNGDGKSRLRSIQRCRHGQRVKRLRVHNFDTILPAQVP